MASTHEFQPDLVGEPKAVLNALESVENLLASGRRVFVETEQDIRVKYDDSVLEELRSFRTVFRWASLQPVFVLPDQRELVPGTLHFLLLR
jgi:hypothetical protein